MKFLFFLKIDTHNTYLKHIRESFKKYFEFQRILEKNLYWPLDIKNFVWEEIEVTCVMKKFNKWEKCNELSSVHLIGEFPILYVTFNYERSYNP